jgi:heme A synthase
MEPKTFYTQLLVLSLVVAAVVFFLNRVPKLQADAPLSWLSLFLFIALSALMFFIGKRTAKSENKNDFTNVVLGFTIGKMFLSIMVIYAYMMLMEPEGKFFIIPFFIVYFMFTAFETYFMMKLGKTKV